MSAVPRFDARFLLGPDPDDGFDRSVDVDDVPEGYALYPGKNVYWVGKPGTMIKLTPNVIIPMRYNRWYPNQLAWTKYAAKNKYVLKPPVAMARLVTKKLIDYTKKLVSLRELHRPLRESDLGKPCAELQDGNHRGFGAILAGEPYIYAYVPTEYRKYVREYLE